MNCSECPNYNNQDRCPPDCDPDLVSADTKNEAFKKYALAKREWEKQPFFPNEDLGVLADRLEALLPEDMRTVDGRSATVLELEVAQGEKEKRAVQP